MFLTISVEISLKSHRIQIIKTNAYITDLTHSTINKGLLNKPHNLMKSPIIDNNRSRRIGFLNTVHRPVNNCVDRHKLLDLN
jgi:arsenate reductase-like glutaredoxin family protein